MGILAGNILFPLLVIAVIAGVTDIIVSNFVSDETARIIIDTVVTLVIAAGFLLWVNSEPRADDTPIDSDKKGRW